MNREEKQVEMTIETMLSRINEIKTTLSNIIFKLENDYHNISLPDFMDSFSVISGQLNTIVRLMKSERLPLLKGLTVLPLSLSQEKDQTLVNNTDGRLNCFNHEVVPDYLRTKPDPDVEAKHNAVEMRGSQANQDTINKQAASLTKIANHVVEVVNNAREEWEASERGGIINTCSMSDTQELVSALFTGKAFKQQIPPASRVAPSSTTSTATATQSQSKAPGIKISLKPNIKGKY